MVRQGSHHKWKSTSGPLTVNMVRLRHARRGTGEYCSPGRVDFDVGTLSESIPKILNGNLCLASLSPAKTHTCALFFTASVLSPRRTYIGHIQGLDEVPTGITSLVGHKVDLYKSRAFLIPLAEGADRDLVLQQRSWFGVRSCFQLVALPHRSK